MFKSNQIYLLISVLYIGFLISCKNDTPVQSTAKPDQNNEAIIIAALQTVQDSLQLDEADAQRMKDIIIKYEAQTREIQQQQFNNPKSKKQVMQNLLKSRRTELSDILKPKEMLVFNKLYKQSLANERKRAAEEKQLSPEDRKAFSKQLQEYRMKSVLPKILEHRKALEAAMTSADKTQISGLREKIGTFNISIKDKKTACAAIEKSNKKAKMECRRELRALQKTYDPIKKETEKLVALLEEKSGTKTVMSAIENQRDIWRADLKQILESYSENEVPLDKVPLAKYFRMASTTNFLIINPENIDESAFENEEEIQ